MSCIDMRFWNQVRIFSFHRFPSIKKWYIRIIMIYFLIDRIYIRKILIEINFGIPPIITL